MRLSGAFSASSDFRFHACLDALTQAKGFGLAVSGGPDSTAMLLMFARWRSARGDVRPVRVFTVDHGLRPESAREAQDTAAMARALGLEHETLPWQHAGIASGVQQKARAARYRLMGAACRVHGLSHLLLAHTLDDQAETVLMRLIRGSGLDGLAAMRKVRLLEPQGPYLVRPLMAFRKVELLSLLNDAGTSYASDPSNENPAFKRVWARQLMREIEAREPDASTRLAATAARMARASDALEAVVSAELEANLSVSPAGEATLPVEHFQALHQEIRLRILRRFIARLTSSPMPEEEKLLALEERLFARSGAHSLAGLIFSRASGRLVVNREYGRNPPPAVPAPVADALFWDSRFLIRAGQGAEADLTVEMLGPRWPQAKAALDLEAGPALGEATLQALPCFTRNGEIVGLPYFGFAMGFECQGVVRQRLLGAALTNKFE